MNQCGGGSSWCGSSSKPRACQQPYAGDFWRDELPHPATSGGFWQSWHAPAPDGKAGAPLRSVFGGAVELLHNAEAAPVLAAYLRCAYGPVDEPPSGRAAASPRTSSVVGTIVDENTQDLAGLKCANTCDGLLLTEGNVDWSSDGGCDDGGPGSQFDACAFGTDCADCGPRAAPPAQPPPPPPPPPAGPASPPPNPVAVMAVSDPLHRFVAGVEQLLRDYLEGGEGAVSREERSRAEDSRWWPLAQQQARAARQAAQQRGNAAAAGAAFAADELAQLVDAIVDDVLCCHAAFGMEKLRPQSAFAASAAHGSVDVIIDVSESDGMVDGGHGGRLQAGVQAAANLQAGVEAVERLADLRGHPPRREGCTGHLFDVAPDALEGAAGGGSVQGRLQLPSRAQLWRALVASRRAPELCDGVYAHDFACYGLPRPSACHPAPPPSPPSPPTPPASPPQPRPTSRAASGGVSIGVPEMGAVGAMAAAVLLVGALLGLLLLLVLPQLRRLRWVQRAALRLVAYEDDGDDEDGRDGLALEAGVAAEPSATKATRTRKQRRAAPSPRSTPRSARAGAKEGAHKAAGGGRKAKAKGKSVYIQAQ